MHMHATLVTVASYHLETANTPLRLTPFTADVLYHTDADPAFLDWINSWVCLDRNSERDRPKHGPARHLPIRAQCPGRSENSLRELRRQ